MPRDSVSSRLRFARCPECSVAYLWKGEPFVTEACCPMCGERLHVVQPGEALPLAPGRPLAMRHQSPDQEDAAANGDES
jgi:hypothetical protein